CEAGSSHPPTGQDASPSVLPCLVVVLAIRSPSQTSEQPARSSVLVLLGGDALCRAVRNRLSAPRSVVVLVLLPVTGSVHQLSELVDGPRDIDAVAVVITVDELGRKNLSVLLRKPGKRLMNVYRDRIDLGRMLSEIPVLQGPPNLLRGVAVIPGEVVVVDPLD